MMTGVPSAEIHTKNSKSLYASDHLYLADYIIESFGDLSEKVQDILINNKFTRDKSKNDQLNKYTEKYLYKVDGNRCREYADKIDGFIRNSTLIEVDINILKQIQLLIKYSYLRGRKTISEIKRGLVQLAYSRNKKYKINNIDNRIDHLGRFDNRMKPGDEEYWFNKFKDINFS